MGSPRGTVPTGVLGAAPAAGAGVEMLPAGFAPVNIVPAGGGIGVGGGGGLNGAGIGAGYPAGGGESPRGWVGAGGDGGDASGPWESPSTISIINFGSGIGHLGRYALALI